MIVTVRVCTGACETEGVAVTVKVLVPLGPELEPLPPQAVMVSVPRRTPATAVANANTCTNFFRRWGIASNTSPAKPKPPPVNDVNDGQTSAPLVCEVMLTTRLVLADWLGQRHCTGVQENSHPGERPGTEKVTLPVNEGFAAVVNVISPVCPCFRVSVVGLAPITTLGVRALAQSSTK